jgi:hypothetical protein
LLRAQKATIGRKNILDGPAAGVLQALFMSPGEQAREEAERMEFFANKALREVLEDGVEDGNAGWLDRYDGETTMETMETMAFMDGVEDMDGGDGNDTDREDTGGEDEGMPKDMTLAEFVSPDYARVVGNDIDIDPNTVLSPIVYRYNPEGEGESEDSRRTTSSERLNTCVVRIVFLHPPYLALVFEQRGTG